MKNLLIKSSFGNYTVRFTDSLEETLSACISNKGTHFLIDESIWMLNKKRFSKLEKKPFSLYVFKAKETSKTLQSVTKYANFLLTNKIDKGQRIVVIGGGLVQDIGSFTAHILKRGLEWIFIPTTLLSMADSCIGGKSGINTGGYKNQVGAFHPPIAIYISCGFLDSLPKFQIYNGIGEILKHALIKGGKSFENIKGLLSIYSNSGKIESQLVYESLKIKKEIVETDELDTGVRHLLNYGHSFGHALEAYTKNRIPHGIAVSIGMDLANFISVKEGMLSLETYENLSKFIYEFVPYKKVKVDNIKTYMNMLSRDKKVVGNELKAILCHGVGNITIHKLTLNNDLAKMISKYFNSANLK